jgi:cation diffusion facilitator family transporter
MDIKVKAAGLSVASNIALTAGKLVVGSIIGSVSVISEAIHSANDLLASFIALWAVRKSAQPPDQEHPYGHGKVENIAGTIEAVLIFIAAVFIISESIEKIRQGGEILEPGWGMLVMAVSAGLNFMVSSYLLKVGKEQDSVALEADGVHLRTDVYTSLGVMAGLGLIQLSGYWILDPIIAILVLLKPFLSFSNKPVFSFCPFSLAKTKEPESVSCTSSLEGSSVSLLLNSSLLLFFGSGFSRFLFFRLNNAILFSP